MDMATILVIDDEEEIRKVLQTILEEAGHEVSLAVNGAEGLSLFRKEPAEIVITDLIMPGKEGIETIRDLRAQFPDVKIIAISGRGGSYTNANLDRAVMIGADRSVPKPFGIDEILNVVSELAAINGSPSG
jgi:DNA-binding response OmpR family regulator